MTDADAPLNVNTDFLASIRAEAQIGLEINGDSPDEETDWPRLPDDSYTPEEIAEAYGGSETFDADDTPQNDGERDAFIEAMSAQSDELQRQARQLEVLERKMENGPRESVLA